MLKYIIEIKSKNLMCSIRVQNGIIIDTPLIFKDYIGKNLLEIKEFIKLNKGKIKLL